MNTYWQILVQVRNLKEARYKLFEHGIESGGTNLPLLIDDLDQAKYPGAYFIKNNLIFVPIHSWLSASDYGRIINLLS